MENLNPGVTTSPVVPVDACCSCVFLAVWTAPVRSITQEIAADSRSDAVLSSERGAQRENLHPLQSPQTGHQVQESQFSGPHGQNLRP